MTALQSLADVYRLECGCASAAGLAVCKQWALLVSLDVYTYMSTHTCTCMRTLHVVAMHAVDWNLPGCCYVCGPELPGSQNGVLKLLLRV